MLNLTLKRNDDVIIRDANGVAIGLMRYLGARGTIGKVAFEGDSLEFNRRDLDERKYPREPQRDSDDDAA